MCVHTSSINEKTNEYKMLNNEHIKNPGKNLRDLFFILLFIYVCVSRLLSYTAYPLNYMQLIEFQDHLHM